MSAPSVSSLPSSGLLIRVGSALVIGPVALVLALGHFYGFLFLLAIAAMISAVEWAGIVRVVPRRKVWVALAGLIYLPACFYAFYDLRAVVPDGAFLFLVLLLAVWASDSGAYLFGKTIGGPKWIPSVSPNKTWAGLFGAMLFSGLAVMALGLLSAQIGAIFPNRMTFTAAEAPILLLFGMAMGFVGQIGDLFISLFKRRAGLKDTGRLIPGHGGLLDRIDALLLVGVFFDLTLHLVL